MEQRHLDRSGTVNYGSFYTPEWVEVCALLAKNGAGISRRRILDASCGYGGFLRGKGAIGADIDETAIETAQKKAGANTYYCHNSLANITRSRYNLQKDEKLIIVGNPPYNDTTSTIQNKIKQTVFERDRDVFVRLSMKKHPGMINGLDRHRAVKDTAIEGYFRKLLGKHCVE